MDVDFDFGEFRTLEADLFEAAAAAAPNVRKAVETTARNVKDDWRDEARKSNAGGHAKQYPRSIDYDMILDRDGEITAEIGPNLERGGQAALGILEDAPGGVMASPQHNVERALRKNLRDFEQGILAATEDPL